MAIRSWFSRLFARKTPARRRPRARLLLEALEDRTLLNSYLAASTADLINDINLANAAGGANTITLTAPSSSPYTLTAVDNTTDGATGLPVIAVHDNLTIVANGDTIARSAVAGTPAFRLLDVAAGASLTLEGLTLQNGLASGSGVSAQGGAIYSQGALTLNGVTVQNNTARGADGASSVHIGGDGAEGLGGAIYVGSGAVTLNNSTLSDNAAQGGRGGDGLAGGLGGDGGGGAIYVNGGASATLLNSSLSGNTAQGGAGGSGDGTGQNGPAGRGFGGGLYNDGTATLTNVTVSGNSASWDGGGLFNQGTATLSNTIVAGNSAPFNGPDIFGGYSGSHDLVGGDPELAPLGDYGGPTQTMALLAGSPAIDAGDSTAPGLPTTDQRGFARISGAAVDIGAYEVQEPILSPATLPDGTYGAAYSQALTATEDTGGAGGPFTLAVTAGTLPPGLGLDGTDGELSGTATAAGTYTFTVTATDSGGFTASQSYTVTIDKADLYVTAAANSKTYGQTASDTGTLSGLVNGDSITASFASPGDAAGANAGSYAITATLADPNNQLANYTVHESDATLTVNPAALTVTADNQGMTYGGSVPPLTYHYTGLVNGDTSASFTGALATTATGSNGVGSYPITQGSLAATGNYTIGTFNGGTLSVAPAPLSAAGVNFSATAGAPFSGTVATFINADPFGSAASYTALITWGDGSTSAGVISGTGSTLTVSGSHTYAAPVNEAVSVQISHVLGDTTTATVSDTATVTGLGQGVTSGMTAGIGFWHNKNGQALITSFNGGPTATALSAWLAASFPNLYGAGAGTNSLAGKTNSQVAGYFQTLFALGGTQVRAQVLAVALDVYATTSSLGGTAGVAYGFAVSATGLGARSYSAGKDGAAFGVANNTTLNVYELLVAVNKRAKSGVLYGGNATLQAQCANLLSALNSAATGITYPAAGSLVRFF